MTVRARAPRQLVALVAVFLPAVLRRLVLVRLLGHEIDRSARIGCSFVDVDHLVMGPGARIGNLNALRGCERVVLERDAEIGHVCWVNAVRRDKGFFAGIDRDLALVLREGASLGSMHLLDCCDRVEFGAGASLTGCWSLVMTHSFNAREDRQTVQPITVGAGSEIGPRCVLLPGSALGRRCRLLAGSTLSLRNRRDDRVYAGVPAHPYVETEERMAVAAAGS